MNKLIISTTILVLFMTFVVPAILAFGIKMIPGADQPGYDINNRRGIFGAQTVRQEFVSKSNNLTSIGISLGNPNLKNQKEIRLNLYDQDGREVRSSSLNGLNIGDGAFVKFVFSPIADSKDKKFSFVLSSPEASPEQIINIFVNNTSTDQIGSAQYGTDKLTNGLPIVTYYKSPTKLSVVGGIYLDWTRRIFSF